MIKAILACDEKGGIAKDGTLPWPNNSRDLRWYKYHTTDNVIVMGSTTWADPHMPCPMPDRVNAVVTSRPATDFPGAHHVITDNILTQIKELDVMYPDKTVWIIGGANLIDQTLGIIDQFYISRIPGDHGCDTFLPLKKIETLFQRHWKEVHPEVTFEIWNKA